MMERLKELVPLWAVLGFFATAVGALGAMSPEGSLSRKICYALVLTCALIALLALILERLRRLSGYLGSGIRTLVICARENLLVVASLATVVLLLWRLFDLGRDPAVFSIVPLLVVACIALTIGLIRLLAMARPSFLGLAARAEERREESAAANGLWTYDFIDHFAEAEKIGYRGSIIRVHPNAKCGEKSLRSIFEHPPEDPNQFSALTYNLTPPRGTRPLELVGLIGIQAEISEAGGPRMSKRDPENGVHFDILINGEREWQAQKYSSEWEEFWITVPRGESLSITFRTNCLGNTQYNWAVWGEPWLVEVGG